jgi:CBS-domain-containing membrane protein
VAEARKKISITVASNFRQTAAAPIKRLTESPAQNAAMILVRHILDNSRGRLAVLSQSASLCEAAGILANTATPLVVVCDRTGVASGVLTRTDIIKALARSGGDAVNLTAGALMSREILACHLDQGLQQVWDDLNAQSLRCAPILDDDGRPQGVVHARDLARALLDEVTYEEGLLRDYVLGVGYQ